MSQPAAPPSSEPPPAPAPQSGLRRQLLKGLLAGLPAILTLRSGTALAMSSAAKNCTRNNPPRTGGRCLFNQAQPDDSYLWMNEITAQADFDPGDLGEPAVPPNPATDRYNANDWCVVYVDAAGTVDMSPPNFGGNGAIDANPVANRYAMTRSCWASFN